MAGDQSPRCPRCPACGEPPAAVLYDGRQLVCGNDGCSWLHWDPWASREENLALAEEDDW